MPDERAHGEVVILSVPNSKLVLEVLERIEFMGSVEVFVVLSVTPFDLTIMPGCKRFDEFMANTELSQRSFKQGFFVRALGVQSIGKLEAVIGLYAFDGIRKAFYTMLNEL